MRESTTLDNLVKRMERLEQQNHRLKMIGAGVLAWIVAVVVMGQSSCNMSQVGSGKVAKVIEAEQFILKDRNGRKRAALQMDKPGGIEFASGLFLYDEEGKERAHLIVDFHGQSYLVFYNNNGEHIADLFGGWSQDGSDVPSLRLSNGKQHTELHSDWFGIIGAGGAASMRADENNDGVSLRLNGKDGYSAVLGSTQLSNTRTGTIEKRPESSLVFFNKDDKVIWQAPR